MLRLPLFALLPCALLQADWIATPADPADLIPAPTSTWETDYQERVTAMVGAQSSWPISNGNADNDEGKRTWSPLLAEIWKDRDDNTELNAWITGTGNQLLNSAWAGSFYKAFTSPGYNGYYFRFKDYNASVALPAAQVTTAQAAVGSDATGNPNSNTLDKGWAYFARPDHHMDPIFTFTEFNSENFNWMHRLAALQWAYEFPDLNLGTTFYGASIPSSRDWTQQWTDNWVRSVFAAGRGEWNSANYWSYTFNPVATLYDLPPGHLPVPGLDAAETDALKTRIRLQARAVADWMVLENALHYLDGFRGGPDVRAKSNVQDAFFGDTWAWMYAQFGADEGTTEHSSFSRTTALSEMPLEQIGFIAWTDYRPLRVLLNIAHRDYALPVEIQSAKPHYSLDENDYANWDASAPWSPHPSLADYGTRFEFETLYLDENCLVASAATFRPDGDAEMTSQQNFFSEQNLWRIMAKGSDNGALQVTGTTLADPGYYKLAGRDPWENIGQHGGVMILAVKRPDSDNGEFMVVPKEATREMQGDYLFVDLGNGVYFAALPVSTASVTSTNSSHSTTHQRYEWRFSADTFGAVVIELGVARDHNSFSNFKNTILVNLGSRLNLPAADTVAYTATDGETTQLEWQRPWTNQAGEPDYELSDGTFWGDDPGEAAGVVPRLWRDGIEVDYATWEAYEVVRGEDIVHQEWGGDRVRIAAGGEAVEIRVDPTTAEVSYHTLTTTSTAEAWRQEYFGTNENIGNAADDYDYDKDGLVNRIERAFGTVPTDATSYYRPSPSLYADHFASYPAFTYRRRSGGRGTTAVDYTIEGLTYTVEYDTDLNEPWQSGGLTVLSIDEETPAEDLDTVTVRSPFSFAEAPQQFFRLAVE